MVEDFRFTEASEEEIAKLYAAFTTLCQLPALSPYLMSATPPAQTDTTVIPLSFIQSLVAIHDAINSLWKKSQALFEWQDGALVTAMKNGDILLIDEISLAEDAVLERLNSVLEPGRTLFLAERGGDNQDNVIVAHPRFRVVATMNPGGDFGKKELSPALRNRFTEIWVPAISNKEDLIHIISERLDSSLSSFAPLLLEFVQWFNTAHGRRSFLSLRDILSWAGFMNTISSASVTSSAAARVDPYGAFVHGASLVVLDGLGAGTGDSELATERVRADAIDFLLKLIPSMSISSAMRALRSGGDEANAICSTSEGWGVAPFFIPFGPDPIPQSVHYALSAPTTQSNLLRVLRALQLPKAILLEGSPGVGKTSILTAIAAATGHPIVRINLSEQTDMMDLLG